MGKRDTVPREIFEKVDSKPLAAEVKLGPPLSMEARLRQLIQSERLAAYAKEQGVETWEEANDFEVDDDPIPELPDETIFDHELGRDVTRLEHRALEEERHRARVQISALEKRKRDIEKSQRAERRRKKIADSYNEKKD